MHNFAARDHSALDEGNHSAVGEAVDDVANAGHRALDKIYRRERGGLLGYISRHTGPDVACDLLHEVFIRAASSPHLTCLANPQGFLRQIARNLLIDRSRRRSRELRTIPLVEELDAPVCALQETECLARELAELYQTALAGLPTKTRRVFVMHREGSKSYREIHLELGISLATVDYHMMKALAHLREVLDHRQ